MRLGFITTLVLSALLIIAPMVQAITYHTANQMTIAWDPYVPSESEPHNPGDKYCYKVYVRNAGATDSGTLLSEECGTTHTVTFHTEGYYALGVTTVRKVDLDGNGTFDEELDRDENGEIVQLESPKAWSDKLRPEDNPFGARYFQSPGEGPSGLRRN